MKTTIRVFPSERLSRVWVYPLFFMGVLLITNSCKKEETVVPPTAPSLLTANVTSVSETSAICGGLITSFGGAAISAKGICWSTSSTPTIADSKTNDTISKNAYISYMTGLTPNTTYYVRAYAINIVGTSYGNTQTFKTWPHLFAVGSGITDIDGNNYKTVIIGTQEWMAENLKTTKFNDGTSITLVSINADWQNITTPGLCWYNNDETTNKNTYGALYNWYAVNSGKLCPVGWHVPTNEEWAILEASLGGDTLVGGRMKDTGTVYWNSPNFRADNRGGFTALPAGYRISAGDFDYLGRCGRWWSATELSNVSAWYRSIFYSNAQSQRGYGSKTYGYSVRCVKD